jgi:hypothetical protein
MLGIKLDTWRLSIPSSWRVRERRKVRQGAPVKLFGSELADTVIPQADSESFDERK